MKRLVLVAAMALIMLAACSSGASGADKAKEVAQSQMAKDGFANAAITDVAKGDATAQGADELYCVATDATTENGELPYLLLVWRDGSDWQVKQLAEGYYDWDLQGCPR
jgi:hypothetical protein